MCVCVNIITKMLNVTLFAIVKNRNCESVNKEISKYIMSTQKNTIHQVKGIREIRIYFYI